MGVARYYQPPRVLKREGKRDEARTILAEIYNRFTESFDTGP